MIRKKEAWISFKEINYAFPHYILITQKKTLSISFFKIKVSQTCNSEVCLLSKLELEIHFNLLSKNTCFRPFKNKHYL